MDCLRVSPRWGCFGSSLSDFKEGVGIFSEKNEILNHLFVILLCVFLQTAVCMFSPEVSWWCLDPPLFPDLQISSSIFFLSLFALPYSAVFSPFSLAVYPVVSSSAFSFISLPASKAIPLLLWVLCLPLLILWAFPTSCVSPTSPLTPTPT